MPIQLSLDQLRFLRQRAQRLGPHPRLAPLPPEGVVEAVCVVQAQDAYAAALSVWARSAGLTDAGVERARAGRTLVRTWCLRGTLHLLATADMAWLLPLVGPFFAAAGRSRRMALGLDDETCARGLKLLRDVLGGAGPLLRPAIVERLAQKGLPLHGQAVPHLLGLAAFEGLICLGPDVKNKPTYVLLEDWLGALPPAPPRAEALAILARRYLQAYGPAAPADLGVWSGLPAGDVRLAWQSVAGEVVEASFEGSPLWMLKPQAEWLDEAPPAGQGPEVRLLPAFDTYLLGYKRRDFIIAEQDFRRVNNGGGIIHAVLLVDGWAAATWQMVRKGVHLEVRLEPFEDLPEEVMPGLQAEVADLGRFLESSRNVKIEIV